MISLFFNLGILCLATLFYFLQLDKIVSSRQREQRFLTNIVFGLIILDGIVTLLGQSFGYWQGNFVLCREGNFIGNLLLSSNPTYFVSALVGYACFDVYLIRKIRSYTIANLLGFAIIIGHISGIVSWINRWIFIFATSISHTFYFTTQTLMNCVVSAIVFLIIYQRKSKK